MSFRGAPWLERAERVAEELPDDVVAAMDLKPGDIVADIGAGSGFFSRRIARQVGPEGKVYAVDIQPEMLEILVDKAGSEGIRNIEPVLGAADDPNLPADAIDWMILVDVYHEISAPEPMLARMYEALKPGGRVALLEYRLEDASGDHIFPDHRMSARQVLSEWGAAGFELEALLEFLPSQHMFILRRPIPGQDAQAGIDAMDLLEAGDAGAVRFTVEGAGRYAVRIDVERTTPGIPLLLTTAAGTFFRSLAGHRDMVAVRDGFVLLDDEPVSFAVRSAGARWDAPVAEGGERFEASPTAADAPLARVARAIQGGTYRVGPDAAIASYAAQSVGTAEAALWIALHNPGYEDIASALGDPEVPGLYAAAFGLVFCDRAGIELSSRRLWDARSGIFGRLQVDDLAAWFRLAQRR